MRARRWVAAIVLIASACQHQTPEQKLVKSVEPAISWTATLQFASERWLLNRVPSKFMNDAIQSAQKELQKALKATDQSNAPKSLRDTIRKQLEEVSDAAAYVDHAVQSDDRGAVRRALGRFAGAYKALDDIKEHVEQ